MVEVARAAEDAGADVLVEVPRQALDHEAALDDCVLERRCGAGPPRAEREEHVAPLVERVRRAGEEEPSARGRVGRIGDDGVELACQLLRQRPAEVVLDARDRKRRVCELNRQEADQRGVDVHHREPRDRRVRAEAVHEEAQRQAGQVVVAEQEHAAPDERAGLVDREQAAELRVHRAVALVELEPGGRAAAHGLRELAHEGLQLVGEDDPAGAAARARSRAEPKPALRRRARAPPASAAPAVSPRRRTAGGARRRRRRRSGPAALQPG